MRSTPVTMGLADLPPSERTDERRLLLALEEVAARLSGEPEGAPLRLPAAMAARLGHFGGMNSEQAVWSQQSKVTLTIRCQVVDAVLTVTLTTSEGDEFAVQFH